MESLSTEAQAPVSDRQGIQKTNLENAINSYGHCDFDDMTENQAKSFIKDFLLSHQKDWDILFLDAFDDINSKYETIAILITEVFMDFLNQKLPIEQGASNPTHDIQVGLHKIARLLIPKINEGDYSLKKLQRFYATGERLTSHQKDWNTTIDNLDSTLHSYGEIVIARLVNRTRTRVGKNTTPNNDTSDNPQFELLAPANTLIQ